MMKSDEVADSGEKSSPQSNNPNARIRKKIGSRLISRILPAAVRLWLKSQVDQVSDLSIQIEGCDRDILSGYIPGIAISARQAIYRGIHIKRLQLSAADIRINVGEVIRGKPLRLLKMFPIDGEATMTAADLNASLSSALLHGGLQDFWQQLLKNQHLPRLCKARYRCLTDSVRS
ncbi:MAG: DUF2993 domain-containing protein, partial [Phormidesmis sp. RL_2_1]|nr:DUF2993 domain-containing protein [Phormidesmis sp. RL_2_1]